MELHDLMIFIINAKNPEKKAEAQEKIKDWADKFATPEAIKKHAIELWRPLFQIMAEEMSNPLNPLQKKIRELQGKILAICLAQIKQSKKAGNEDSKIFEKFYVEMMQYHKAILLKKANEIKEGPLKIELEAESTFLDYKLIPFSSEKFEVKAIEKPALNDDLMSLGILSRFKKDPAQLILLHAHIALLTRSPVLAKEKFKLPFRNIEFLHTKSRKFLDRWSRIGHNDDLKKFATLMLLTLNDPFIDKILQLGFRENIPLNLLLRALFANENYVDYLAQEENKANIQKQYASIKVLDKVDVAIKLDQIILKKYEEALAGLFGSAKVDEKEFGRAKKLLAAVKMDNSSKVELQSDAASIKQLSKGSAFRKQSPQQQAVPSLSALSIEKKKTPGI